jgi:hypothetical protein
MARFYGSRSSAIVPVATLSALLAGFIDEDRD